MLTELNKKLHQYFSQQEIEELLKKIENQQRANIMNEKYFAKVGNDKDELFFNHLKQELEIYQKNRDNPNLPKLVDSYTNEKICLIILETIPGKPIGQVRYKYDIHLNKQKRIQIAQSVLTIPDMKVKAKLNNDYSREEKLDKYLSKSKPYLSNQIYQKILENKSIIIKEKGERVIAHGDLISPNIMTHQKNIYFIDWEFISLKPRYYDLIYFLLFSKKNNAIDILFENKLKVDIEEALKDGIILCLKEIQNNAKLFGILEDKVVYEGINRWKKELNNIMKRF